MILHRFAEVGSTQDTARRLAEEGAPHGSLVVAGAQRAGRGTQGRSWASAPGQNLYVTAILRLHAGRPLLLAEAPLLTLGLAARLAEVFGLQVKWPNDLVLPGADGRLRKLGGILGEVETGVGPQVRYVLLGLGLNVNQTAFPPELPDACSLALARGERQDQEAVLAQVAAALQGDLLGGWRERWRRRAHTLGRRVEVQGAAGLARDIAPDGALIIAGAAGERRVYAGDVTLTDERPGGAAARSLDDLSGGVLD